MLKTESRLRLHKRADDEVDMTPMVDMTFLLLIFFMATAAFSLQKSLEVPAPKEDEAAAEKRTLEDFETDDSFVVVRVTENDTFWVDEREAPSVQELLVQLRDTRRLQPSAARVPSKMLVLAEPRARHEMVVFALDAGTEVGMNDVRLATQNEAF